MDDHPEREYGLSDHEAVGVPTAKPVPSVDAKCPNCGCEAVHVITVDVKMNLLTSHVGQGTYLGCPACPWASPMVAVARRADPSSN
jgi:hypothetical protein